MGKSLDFILWVGSLNSGHTPEAHFKDNQCSPGSGRRVQTSGSLLPLNLIPFFTLPLTYTSLYYPWAVYTLFLAYKVFSTPFVVFAPLAFNPYSSPGLECTLPALSTPGETLSLPQAHVK